MTTLRIGAVVLLTAGVAALTGTAGTSAQGIATASPHDCSAHIAVVGPDTFPRPRFRYIGRSTSTWEVGYAFGSIETCLKHGTRHVAFHQEQSTDGGATWHKSSNSRGFATDQEVCGAPVVGGTCPALKLARLKAPYDCAAKPRPVVRAVFTIHWVPKPGHGKSNSGSYDLAATPPRC